MLFWPRVIAREEWTKDCQLGVTPGTEGGGGGGQRRKIVQKSPRLFLLISGHVEIFDTATAVTS